jgi:hypothetical protein
VRSIIYVGINRAAIDERGFEMARRLRRAHGDMPIAEFKALVREQFNILLIDQEAALAAIPSMLPPEVETREKAYELVQQVLGARGELSAEDANRLREIACLFGLEDDAGRRHLRPVGKEPKAKAS